MIVSYRWLSRHLERMPDPDTVQHGLEQLGLEVANRTTFGQEFEAVELVEVMRRVPHPASDHLSLVTVRRAQGEAVQVVTGAKNGHPGDRLWYAPPGTRLPDGRVLETRMLRGIESPGMLLSAEELGYQATTGDLWVWEGREALGTTFLDVIGGLDTLYDVELTPNLAQYLQSMRHLAQELGAIWDIPLVPLTAPFDYGDAPLADVLAPDRCPLYGLVAIRLKPGAASPLWLQTLLRAVGQRIIHPAVDATNFVLWDLGEPLHAFDAQQLHGTLQVRLARPYEVMTLLDGTTLELSARDLVIADDEGPVALAGIMGGARAQVHADTIAIWLECAHFSSEPIFQSYKRHRLVTDAALHFGKGTDPEAVLVAPRLVENILHQGGVLESVGPSVLKGSLPTPRQIVFDAPRISQLLGVTWTQEKIKTALTRLGYQLTASDVVVPRYRHDVSHIADLAEDVARFYGIEAIHPRLPVQRTALARRDEMHVLEEAVRDLVVSAGYDEVMTRTLVSPELEAQYLTGREGEPVRVTNPLREEESVLRRVLLPSLLEVVRYNRARHDLPIRIFEVGTVFSRVEDKVVESRELVALLSLEPVLAFPPRLQPSVYDLTGLADFLLTRLGWPGVRQAWDQVPSFLHPGRVQQIVVNGEPLGYVGELRPRLAESYRVKRLGVLALRWPQDIVTTPFHAARPSRYPEVQRDLSLVIGPRTSYQEIDQVIRRHGGEHLRAVYVVDRYEGEFGISLTVRLIFQSEVGTLTDEEVDRAVTDVVQALQSIDVGLRQ